MRVNSFSICLVLSAYFVVPILIYFPHATIALGRGGGFGGSVAGPVPVSDGPTVRKDERWPLVSSEFGEISAIKISDGKNGCYYLHFITMNPRSLFLPVYLHSEMLLYVNSGSGTLSWINVERDGDKLQQVMLQKGDVYRLSTETVFYLQNNIEAYDYQPQTLQIYAIFPGSEFQLQNEQEVAGVYTGVHDLVLGFDNQVLQSTFSVPEEVIEELRGGEKQPLIVEGQPEANTSMWDVGSWGIRALLGTKNNDIFNVENKRKAYNIFSEDHDVDTCCYGWSVTVTSKELDVLKHTDFGVFMVNLTKGSIMGPHWNPKTVEIAIVLHGQGVVQVVCPGTENETGCQNSRFIVKEGDVFVVPRSHPMAQISFNNDSFVFMGFKLNLKNVSPQYLAGKLSILRRLDRKVLEKSFNVRNTTIDWVLSDQREKIIYECISCAEAEEAAMESEEKRGGEGEGGGRGWQREQRGGGRGPQGEEGGRGRGGGWKEEHGEGRGGIGRQEKESREGGERGWQEEKGRRGGEEGWQEEKGGRGGGVGWQEEKGGGGRSGGVGWQEEKGGGGGGVGWQEEKGGGGGGGGVGWQEEKGGSGGGVGWQEEKGGSGGGVGWPEEKGGSHGGIGWQEEKGGRGERVGWQEEKGGSGGGVGPQEEEREGGMWQEHGRGVGGEGWQEIQRKQKEGKESGVAWEGGDIHVY